MRKIIVFAMVTLDGVMQGPGSPEEDTSGGFKYGGWMAPYGDEIYDQTVEKELEPAEYLLGRKTYKIWAGYWPKHGEHWPSINSGTKYVFSKKLKKSNPMVTGWPNSMVIRKASAIKKLKNTEGPDLHVWGSSKLVQLLFKHDVVDELHLKIHPLTLGKGKKLFSNSASPAAYTLIETTITTTGVIMATYRRAGIVVTGTVGG